MAKKIGIKIGILGSIASIIALAFTFYPQANSKSSVDIEQKQSGNGNIQAGRNVTINNNQSKKLAPGRIRITDVLSRKDGNNKAALDFRLLNTGDTPVTISRVKLKVVDFEVIYPDALPCPYVPPAAVYGIDISQVRKGDETEVQVSHYVDGNQAERFEIHMYASRMTAFVDYVWKIQPTLVTSEGEVVSQVQTISLTRP